MQFDTHAETRRPCLNDFYGDEFANAVLRETRQQYEALIPEIPYIGGDENPMTRHLVRSTTSLVLYKVMKAWCKTAEEVGKLVYDAVVASVSRMPAVAGPELSTTYIVKEKKRRGNLKSAAILGTGYGSLLKVMEWNSTMVVIFLSAVLKSSIMLTMQMSFYPSTAILTSLPTELLAGDSPGQRP